MVQAPANTLTLEAFLKMPLTKPASEFINGRVIQKPMPRPKHSRLQLKLSMTISEVLEAEKIASAFPELRCTFGGRAIVPDISVLQWNRIPRDENGDVSNDFESYPDWAIEILSPQQNSGLVLGKLMHALGHGTQMGWMIDSENRSILVCPAGAQPHFTETMSDSLQVPSFAHAVSLTLGDVFGWLKM